MSKITESWNQKLGETIFNASAVTIPAELVSESLALSNVFSTNDDTRLGQVDSPIYGYYIARAMSDAIINSVEGHDGKSANLPLGATVLDELGLLRELDVVGCGALDEVALDFVDNMLGERLRTQDIGSQVKKILDSLSQEIGKQEIRPLRRLMLDADYDRRDEERRYELVVHKILAVFL